MEEKSVNYHNAMLVLATHQTALLRTILDYQVEILQRLDPKVDLDERTQICLETILAHYDTYEKMLFESHSGEDEFSQES